MPKFTKEEANYGERPFDGYGFFMQATKSVYPCWRCAHWEGAKKRNDQMPGDATCDLVEGIIQPTANCFYWSLLGLRPNFKAPAEIAWKVPKKEG